MSATANIMITIGYTSKVCTKKSHHFLKYFSVFGKQYMAKATGLTSTSASMIAFLMTRVRKAANRPSTTGIMMNSRINAPIETSKYVAIGTASTVTNVAPAPAPMMEPA